MNSSKNGAVEPSMLMGWRGAVSLLRGGPENSRILGGSLVMLVGSGLVSTVNFGYNVAVARLLGPSSFGHAAAVVTLLMLASAITLSFQLICAKFVARSETPGGRATVFSLLLRRAWGVGILLGSGLAVLSGPIAGYLNLPSRALILLLSAGVAFYVPLGVKRGGFQGVCAFSRLTANFLLEVLVKFLGAILLIELGFGVRGAVGAIAASVILAYFLPPTPTELCAKPEVGISASFLESMQAIVFFVGQVVINNIDILLVKHFFQPDAAGVYAAVALVGRVVYMLSWSVVSVMFPISAGAKRESESASVLVVPLIIVLSIALAFTAGLGFFPHMALRVVFGEGFHVAGKGLESLLTLYAAETGVYSLSVVLMAYEMSRRLAKSGYVQLFFSGAIVIGIYFFHSTLREVVVVQLLLMVLLLVAASVPFFRAANVAQSGAARLAELPELPLLTRIRLVTEAEVIAHFLRNEFHHIEFNADRERFQSIVMYADTSNETENALRRALLFRRRGTMWRELPRDTKWWEVDVADSAIESLRVFPRAQWRKLASGSFLLSDIVERIRNNQFSGRTAAFLARIERLSQRLLTHDHNSSILLIGIDECQPLTILEGNHRVTAAMLASPRLVRQRFRFYCGLSPRMTECCWYQTNLATLYRYARNRLKILMYDRETDIAWLLSLHSAKQDQGAENGTLPVTPETEAPTRQAS
jgi:O-antigen/teichoic acid export membrane protein